ncbi:hypothetical protein [Marinomonas sp.]
MSDLKVLTNERLHKLIDETHQTLTELKKEVTRREQLKQEHEIYDLDHHMKSAELNIVGIKNFIAYLLDEAKKK